MRIVTFNNLGTGHLLSRWYTGTTMCGRKYPGVLGKLPIGTQGNGPATRSGARRKDSNMDLCGNCTSSNELRQTVRVKKQFRG